MILVRMAQIAGGIAFALGAFVALVGWTPARPPDLVSCALLVLASIMLIGAASAHVRGARLQPHSTFARSAGLVLLPLALLSLWAALMGAKYDVAYMRSGFEALKASETAFHADSGRYFTDPNLISGYPLDMQQLRGFSVPVITLTADGWTALVVKPSTGERCAVFEGSTALAPAATSGWVECDAPTVGAGLWMGLGLSALGLVLGLGPVLRSKPAT